MQLAPNETPEGASRKLELQRAESTRQLTMAELYELRDLTRAASSHLIFSNAPAATLRAVGHRNVASGATVLTEQKEATA